MTRALFTRSCRTTDPHTRHTYTKRWRLADLPLLPNPERYPAEWDSTYYCPGVRVPGKTLAESMGIVVPESAPGGQRMIRRGYLPRGSAQNRASIDYDGFYDTDAHGGSHHD